MDQDIENILQVAHQDDQPGQFKAANFLTSLGESREHAFNQ